MLPDALRLATPADNDALRELERACPQGSKLKICSERDDYFVRVAVLRERTHPRGGRQGEGPIFGVIAASTKEVLIGGMARNAVIFNDLRIHPDYRRSVLARHMLGAWLAMERWAKDQSRRRHLRTGQGRQRYNARAAREGANIGSSAA